MSQASVLAAQHSGQGNFEAAEQILLEAVAAEPDNNSLRLDLGICYAKQLLFERAIEHCLHVLHKPGASIQNLATRVDTLARCAAQLGVPEMVLPYLDKVDLNTSPHPSDRCWRAMNLRQLGFPEEARRDFLALLADFPGDPFVTHCLGDVTLELGDPAGRPLSVMFSSRAFYTRYLSHIPLIERMWEGEPLMGKSIAFVPEIGHGDCFQAAGHLGQLRRLGARHITVVLNARYAKLLASTDVDEIAESADREAVKARSDYWVGDFGLVRAELNGGGDRKTSGYFKAPPSEEATAWAQRIRERAGGRACIGLYWHSDRHEGKGKSVPLSMLLPLFARSDVHWVILQRSYGLRRLQAAGLAATASVVDVDLSFDDMGTLISLLDGVATIDAWPFHLAGALGIRTWLLAGRVMSSRHLNSEGASYLYPDCARIVRQPKVGGWAGAIARLNEELDALPKPAP